MTPTGTPNSLGHQNLNFWKIQYGGRSPFLKPSNRCISATVWPTGAKFGRMMIPILTAQLQSICFSPVTLNLYLCDLDRQTWSGRQRRQIWQRTVAMSWYVPILRSSSVLCMNDGRPSSFICTNTHTQTDIHTHILTHIETCWLLIHVCLMLFLSGNSKQWRQPETRCSERPARRSVSVELLSYCCTNNANRSRVSLRSTFCICHFLFGYLFSFVHASLQ